MDNIKEIPQDQDLSQDQAKDEGIKEGEGTEKKFSQSEVNKLIGKYRKEDRTKLEAEFGKKLEETTAQYEQRIKDERVEAERVAKLSAEEKESEMKKLQAEKDRERDTTLTQRENRLVAINKLDELDIPIKLVDLVVDIDLKKQEEKIANLKETFDKSVSEEVDKRLKGSDDQEDVSNHNEKKVKDLNPTGVF